jgi:hypothetical protein
LHWRRAGSIKALIRGFSAFCPLVWGGVEHSADAERLPDAGRSADAGHLPGAERSADAGHLPGAGRSADAGRLPGAGHSADAIPLVALVPGAGRWGAFRQAGRLPWEPLLARHAEQPDAPHSRAPHSGWVSLTDEAGCAVRASSPAGRCLPRGIRLRPLTHWADEPPGSVLPEMCAPQIEAGAFHASGCSPVYFPAVPSHCYRWLAPPPPGDSP